MSRDLVTLEQANDHLRLDNDDPMVPLYISAASEAVLDYLTDPSFLDSDGEVPQDSDGPIDVPFQVQAATLLLVGDMFANREPKPSDAVPTEFGYGYLPRAVVALLYPLRSPTIA